MVKTVPPASMKAFSCGTVFATVTPPRLPRHSSGTSSALGIRENGDSCSGRGRAAASGTAAPVTRRDRAGDENDHVEFIDQIARVESLRVDNSEREFELFEQPARPARRHRAAVAVPQRD